MRRGQRIQTGSWKRSKYVPTSSFEVESIAVLFNYIFKQVRRQEFVRGSGRKIEFEPQWKIQILENYTTHVQQKRGQKHMILLLRHLTA